MMAASRKQAITLGVLFVVMAAVYARAFRRPGQAAVSGAAVDQVAPSVPQEPGPDPELASRRASQRVALEQLTWQRDPFSRGPARGHGELTLSGILWDAARPIAIINGETLQPGEEIDGFRIVSIEPTRVVVTDGTQTLQLQIAP